MANPEPKANFLPGLVFVGVAALAALWLSEHYGPPAILMGLLIGLALNFVNSNEQLAPGLEFSSKTLLRIAIVLIGVRITFAEIGSLGVMPFVALLVIVIVVMLTGVLSAKLFKQDVMFGLLAGGATAICGASAALALWSVIGKERIDQSRFTIVLLGITLASAFAMTFYPAIARSLGLSDAQAGFLIGASIHDVAQALGGGFSYSPIAGEVATVVKLSRVTLLAPVLVVVALLLSKWQPRSIDNARTSFSLRQGLPWFLIGFMALIVINSLVQIPGNVVDICSRLASTLLLFAVIAAAAKSDMTGLLAHGWRTFGPIIATTLVAFGSALLFARFLA
jgi:uncharacterized integral membrane protein (TIGR00698 family)